MSTCFAMLLLIVLFTKLDQLGVINIMQECNGVVPTDRLRQLEIDANLVFRCHVFNKQFVF